MNHEIQASLKRFIEQQTGRAVVWIYDGVSLSNVAKPFYTIEALQNNTAVLSKQRESMQTLHRFQIGVYAANSTEKARKSGELRDLLNFNAIPLLNTTVSPATTRGYFYALVTAETSIPADSTDAQSNYHRTYLDVTVERVYGKQN